jgi:phosphate transport system permease protein
MDTDTLLLDLSPSGSDEPGPVDPGHSRADRAFRTVATGTGLTMLVITGAIGLFLGLQAIPTLHHYGLRFFTQVQWQPDLDQLGIAGVLVGTFEVALVAIVIALPLALAVALYITEYAPPRLKPALISLVDLMAAVPSIIWGIWGGYLIMPRALYVAHWLHLHLGWIPFFRVDTDPRAADWAQSRYTSSAFMAGIAVSAMVLPMASAVMREVFDQAPIGEREAARALGATRWGVIRTVVLPFGRGGIVGGSMLALGRALGETISVLLIISPVFVIKFRVLEAGTNTISALIATRASESTHAQLAALLTAGFVLFAITLGINTVAAGFVARSKGGRTAGGLR